MPKIGKIIGPPGTGKTSEIMRLIEEAVKKYAPERIGAISFTKAAVETIANRIRQQRNEIPENFRTIHGHAFKLLGLHQDQICDQMRANKRLIGFCDAYPRWELSGAQVKGDDDDFSYDADYTVKANDAIFSEMQINRHQMLPLEQWSDETQALYRDWMNYLHENDFIDFTGILEKCLRMRHSPDIDIMFVDEAQDMTALQYCLTRMWAENTQSTIYVGDSDQAIYRWAGVTPEVFDKIDHVWHKLLDQSYRVPPKILEYAQDIIRTITDREDVIYKPYLENGPGEVLTCTEPDLSLPGSHMILVRANYQARKWMRWLKNHDVIWHNPYRTKDLGWNPTLTKSWKAYDIYYNLAHGKTITGAALKVLVTSMRQKHTMEHGLKTQIAAWSGDDLKEQFSILDLPALGFTMPFLTGQIPVYDWLDSKTQISDKIAELYTTETPRVIIGTEHSVKGGEADHVWLDSESTKIICSQIHRDIGHARDDEARLSYVAATRARKTLGILRTRSPLKNPLISYA